VRRLKATSGERIFLGIMLALASLIVVLLTVHVMGQ
jgi:hypothetical protein